MTLEINTSTNTIKLTIAFLFLFAIVSITSRIMMRNEGGLPTGDSAWSINAWHTIKASEKGAAVFIPPPWDTRNTRLYSQSLYHPGLRQSRTKTDKKDRDIALTAPQPGAYTIKSTFNIYVSHLPMTEPTKPGLSEQNRASWLSSSSGIEVNTATTTRIVDQIAHDKPETERLIELFFNYVSNNIRIDPVARSDSESALNSKRSTVLGSTRALIALLRTAHLPARIVAGIDLLTPSDQLRYWAEVYDGEKWLPLDPASGYINQLPIFFIPMRKGDDQLIKSDNASVTSSEWAIHRLPSYEGLLTGDTKKPTDILDLTRLNLPSREILSILLLLPLGVLSTELLRQFAGIRTYGTFTPTLLALALTRVDWTTAIVVFLLVTIISVAIRASMPNLGLQRTPRLGIVFTLVAMSMAIVVSGISYFNPAADNTVTLLPLIVLTMLVDRIYTVYDERGLHSAIVRLFWTVVGATVSLFVLLQEHWGTWLVSYPEVHAITLAMIIMIGLYKGPKLKDVPLFRWLQEPSRELRNRKTDKSQSQQPGDSL